MAGTPVFSAANNGAGIVAGSQHYSEVGSGTTGGASAQPEAPRGYSQIQGVTRSNLYVNVFANTTSVSAGSMQFRTSLANGNESVTIPLGTTGEVTDSTHNDPAAATTVVDYSVNGANTGSWQSFTYGNLCTPTAAGTFITQMKDGPNTYSGTGTFYQPISGQNVITALSELRAQWQIQAACTFANMCVYEENFQTGTSAISYAFRIAAANGNQTLTPTGIGFVYDSTHTDPVTAGALVDVAAIVTTLGTSVGETYIAVDQVSSAYQVAYGNGYPTGIAFAVSTTAYVPLTGRFQNNATEANVQAKTGTAFTASDLQAYVEANANTGNSVFTFRKGSAAGNGTVTFGSSATGWLTDATHTDSVLPTSEINFQLVTGSTGAAITPTNLSFTATLPGPAAANPAAILMSM